MDNGLLSVDLHGDMLYVKLLPTANYFCVSLEFDQKHARRSVERVLSDTDFKLVHVIFQANKIRVHKQKFGYCLRSIDI